MGMGATGNVQLRTGTGSGPRSREPQAAAAAQPGPQQAPATTAALAAQPNAWMRRPTSFVPGPVNYIDPSRSILTPLSEARVDSEGFNEVIRWKFR